MFLAAFDDVNVHNGVWIKLAPLVCKLSETDTRQTKRFVDGKKGWLMSNGQAPREGNEWKRITGPGTTGGGDAGSGGPIYIHVDFAKHVYTSNAKYWRLAI